MKLRRELIERMARSMSKTLVDEDLARGMERPDLTHLLATAVTDDLMVEDRLNDEVRELMRQHARQIDQANVEYHEMFKALKAKLVRDRKLIL